MSELRGRTEEFEEFWTTRRLGTLSTVRPGGTIHVVAIAATVDFETSLVRIITSGGSVKARRVARAGEKGIAAAVCQVDGRRWSTLEGIARVRDDPSAVADAVQRYTTRFRVPRVNPERVVLEIVVNRVLGNQ